MTKAAPPRTVVRYELRSAEQLDAIAGAPLPLDIRAGPPGRSRHRDLYLDTPDETLRAQGVTCRLRIGADDRHVLSLRIDGSNGTPPLRIDAVARVAEVQGALAEDTTAARRIRALVDPLRLVLLLEMEVDRLTRFAHPDFFRRPRLELHFDRITIRRDDVVRTFHQLCAHLRRGPAQGLERLANALEAAHDLRQPSARPREHAELLLRWKRMAPHRPPLDYSDQAMRADADVDSHAAPFLNPELSLLAFQRRVLALAEDPRTPLRERLRFLGIVASNLDELYMVRMSGLRAEAGDINATTPRADGLSPRERLSRVEQEVDSLIKAQSRCAQACLAEAAAAGVDLVRWDELAPEERAQLTARCRDEIHPGLTPLAMTLSPGHPLPHLPHLGLSLAVVFRREPGGTPHLAEFELPSDAPRLLPVPGRERDVITMEELLRANVDLLHPNVHVDGAHLFRVTRSGDLALNEEAADDLLEAVAHATERRPYNAAVRVEVERSMPAFVAELVLESLRRDALTQGMDPSVHEVQVIDGLIDLRCLAGLPLPPVPAMDYPVLRARCPVPDGHSMLDAVQQRDLLMHHPFDSFDGTVVRFLREASVDEAVTTIKVTLYRVGEPSPVVEALLAAARAGKRVVAFVELKARFDEEHNVTWARALERAGGNVVYGLVGLKTHAKVALVVRREGEQLRRYAHVGTGNYNARSGLQYTDLSLFSARADITTDIADLFNELTGSSRPPQGLSHGALVAPHQLLPAVLALIAREAEHARAGREAAITIKVNGLADPDVVEALYEASNAGVRIDLVVRGICTLRPGVTGQSERIRVVSAVGRFLEHSRIYRFANDGAPVMFIGSSDLRPRNLRRRVEILVPVVDDEHRTRLERILDLYLADETAWTLQPNGSYHRNGAGERSAQSVLSAEVGSLLEHAG